MDAHTSSKKRTGTITTFIVAALIAVLAAAEISPALAADRLVSERGTNGGALGRDPIALRKFIPLQYAKTVEEYLTALTYVKEYCTVFIAVKDDAARHLSDKAKLALAELGLTTDWTKGFRRSYCAVVENGNVLVDQMSSKKLAFADTFGIDSPGGGYIYSVESAGRRVGNYCSVIIDGEEYAKNERGLNFVVFSSERGIVVSTASFDTYVDPKAPKNSPSGVPHRLACARIDIKNHGEDTNDFEILENSDPGTLVTAPGWLNEKSGHGRVFNNWTGDLKLKLKCIGKGRLEIVLRGVDYRGKDKKRIPVWVQYTKFVVDKKTVFDKVRAACHDQPQRYSINVKDGQIVEVQISWTPDTVRIERSKKK